MSSSKRASNEKRTARMEASHARGARRAEERDEDNDARAHANRDARAAGRPTPYETARALRAERREPLRQAFKLFPSGRSMADWEASRARAEALREGERIREEQRSR